MTNKKSSASSTSDPLSASGLDSSQLLSSSSSSSSATTTTKENQEDKRLQQYPHRFDHHYFFNSKDYYNVGPCSFLFGFPDTLQPASKRDCDIFLRSLFCPICAGQYFISNIQFLKYRVDGTTKVNNMYVSHKFFLRQLDDVKYYHVSQAPDVEENKMDGGDAYMAFLLCFLPPGQAMSDAFEWKRLETNPTVSMDRHKVSTMWDRSLYHCFWMTVCFPLFRPLCKILGRDTEARNTSHDNGQMMELCCPCFLIPQLVLFPLLCYSCKHYQILRELDVRGKLRRSNFLCWPLSASSLDDDKDMKNAFPSPFWISRKTVMLIREGKANAKMKQAFEIYAIAFVTAKFVPHVDEEFYKKFVLSKSSSSSWLNTPMITFRKEEETAAEARVEVALSGNPSVSEML